MSEPPKPTPIVGRLPTPEECREAVRWAIKQGLIRTPTPPPIEVLDLSPDIKRALASKEKELRKKMEHGTS
jgi:hypothetical protein